MGRTFDPPPPLRLDLSAEKEKKSWQYLLPFVRSRCDYTTPGNAQSRLQSDFLHHLQKSIHIVVRQYISMGPSTHISVFMKVPGRARPEWTRAEHPMQENRHEKYNIFANFNQNQQHSPETIEHLKQPDFKTLTQKTQNLFENTHESANYKWTCETTYDY